MQPPRSCVRFLLLVSGAVACLAAGLDAGGPDDLSSGQTTTASSGAGAADPRPGLAELRATGSQRSWFRKMAAGAGRPGEQAESFPLPQANLAEFESSIRLILEQNCVECHGPDKTEGTLRIDTLDPNLVEGRDVVWWTEVFAVLTKGEMPPPDQGTMDNEQRRQVVDWLSSELQTSAVVRRNANPRSAFRRLTRYEYNYALQDLLGLPWDFARDLPPESSSQDGFENSSELLHLSVSQFETYHRLAGNALRRATVRGERPITRYWGVAMEDAAEREWPRQHEELE